MDPSWAWQTTWSEAASEVWKVSTGDALEYEFPFGMAYFQGAILVLGNANG